MSILEQLGVALGLASLAGVNLYLTVLLTGLAIRFDVLQLATHYQALDALAHPIVLAVAGVLFVMEFIADKIPWLDTLWDTVHTFIRPLGGILLSLQSLGEMPAYMQVVAGLVAGGAALTTHGVKASSRLLINHSPEPVSNVSVSLAEDAAVVGGVALTLLHPAIGLAVFAGILLLSWLIFPRLLRGAKATWKLAWHKLQMPGRRQPLTSPVELPLHMDATLRDVLLYKGGLSEKEIRATIPCLTGKSKGIRGLIPNLDGLLILTHDLTHLYFTASKGLRIRLFRVPLIGLTAEVESRFLSENLLLETPNVRAILRFPRGSSDLAETVAQILRQAVGTSVPASPQIETDKPIVEEPLSMAPDPVPAPTPAPPEPSIAEETSSSPSPSKSQD
ncbi:DUF4126 domain-containing protein [Phragmitibacter flavus]|uniref:DUF4126 domain-containing protein n=1 Tax=Phragmitibacter flavus TaxID=2576071 RepID=A0A5R8KAJ7_9BACT|nr:DUF4126 domain-containing protein [Phragmitibacter flavus]TLD69338.1 DUF4126 domain-containing protein [Phragmitibacter flavus]